jgi:hypothetical protein
MANEKSNSLSTKKFRVIEGSFWAGIGAFICVLAWRVQLGTFREPGPGFVAFVAGLFILVVGLVMVSSQVLSRLAHADRFDVKLVFRNVSWTRLAYTMALLFGYGIFLNKVGFLVMTTLVLWGLLYDEKKTGWVVSFMKSVVIAGASYLVFEVWLKSQLPRGILPWW